MVMIRILVEVQRPDHVGLMFSSGTMGNECMETEDSYMGSFASCPFFLGCVISRPRPLNVR